MGFQYFQFVFWRCVYKDILFQVTKMKDHHHTGQAEHAG
jgi:hypothetical protein